MLHYDLPICAVMKLRRDEAAANLPVSQRATSQREDYRRCIHSSHSFLILCLLRFRLDENRQIDSAPLDFLACTSSHFIP